MTNINLLPWRELRREQEKKESIIYLAIGLAFSLLLLFLVYQHVTGRVDAQRARNTRLQTEINNYKQQIKEIKNLQALRESLIARMTIVQELQAARILAVRLFDELIRILPDGVYVTNMKRVSDSVTLYGYTESNSNISRLMRNIEYNDWIQFPKLTEIKKSTKGAQRLELLFKLSFVLRPKVGTKFDEPKS